MDSAASEATRGADLADQLVKAQARIKELEPKDTTPASKPPP
jgi:hypothetical protein